MKGIVLAGGSGTRLWPMTATTSKQLLPIFDKPMVYYPLSVLLHAGIREILLISTPQDIGEFKSLLGNGERFGVRIEYAVQRRPAGIAQALIIAKKFLDGQPSTLILGDNLFHGEGITGILRNAAKKVIEEGGAHLFATRVPDPSRFGVAFTDGMGGIEKIIEKPENPDSDFAVTGLYMYDSLAPQKALHLSPSERGELEITDLNMAYVSDGEGKITIFEEEIVWLDSGTPESLHSASEYVKSFQTSTGKMIACLEEIAWKNGFLSDQDLDEIIGAYPEGNLYGKYVLSLLG